MKFRGSVAANQVGYRKFVTPIGVIYSAEEDFEMCDFDCVLFESGLDGGGKVSEEFRAIEISHRGHVHGAIQPTKKRLSVREDAAVERRKLRGGVLFLVQAIQPFVQAGRLPSRNVQQCCVRREFS